MRIVMLLPLALAAVAVGGCRTASEGTEQAALGVPQRDLTLQQAAAPEVEIASPVELARVPRERPTTQRPRRAHRPTPARASRRQPAGSRSREAHTDARTFSAHGSPRRQRPRGGRPARPRAGTICHHRTGQYRTDDARRLDRPALVGPRTRGRGGCGRPWRALQAARNRDAGPGSAGGVSLGGMPAFSFSHPERSEGAITQGMAPSLRSRMTPPSNPYYLF